MPTARDRDFHGITICNSSNNSKISLEFNARGNDFPEIVRRYHNRLDEYKRENREHNK